VVVVGSGPIDSTYERFSHRPDRVFSLDQQTFRNRDVLGQEYSPDAGAVDATFYTVVHFPDGDMEVSGCHRPCRTSASRPRVTEEEKAKIESDRARRELLRVAKWHCLDHLWTLTYRGPMTDRRRLFNDLHKFERFVRKVYPQFALVGVPELHHGGKANDGGFHFHFAVHGFFEVEELRKAWWKVVGEAQGNVDAESKCNHSPRLVGLYLSKYIAKELEAGYRIKGQHRYRRSHHLQIRKLKKKFVGGRGRERENALKAYIIVTTGRPLAFEWWSDDGLQFVFRTFR
jgi:hypothetical protein